MNNKDGRLLIDCTDCDRCFTDRNPECFACVVRNAVNGPLHTGIVIRDGYDTELPERACRTVFAVADGMDWLKHEGHNRLRCRTCPLSPGSVRDMIWAGFPEAGIRSVRRCINGSTNRDPACLKCIKDTSRALEQVEETIDRACD